jgi:hypothetical protein
MAKKNKIELPDLEFDSTQLPELDFEVKKKDEVSGKDSLEREVPSTLISEAEGYTPPEISVEEEVKAREVAPGVKPEKTEFEEELKVRGEVYEEESKKRYQEELALYSNALNRAKESISQQREVLNKQFPEPTKITPTSDPEYPLIETNPQYAERRDLINLSEKYINEIESRLLSEGGKGGLNAAKLRTKNFEDLVSLGWSKVFDVAQVKDIAKKVEKGEQLNQDEMTTLALYGFKEDVSKNVEVPLSYDVVGGIIDMIPYMVNIAATGGIGSGVSKATGQVLKEGTKKTIGKYATRGANYLLGKSVQALAFPATYEGTIERQIGEVGYDEKGGITVIEGDSPGKAFLKSYGSTIAEIGVEGFKQGVFPTNKILSKNKFTNLIRNEAQFGKFGEELAEEFVTAVLQAPIKGQSLEETFTPRMIATTTLTVGAMSGAVSAADFVAGKTKGEGIAKTRTDMMNLGNLLSSETKKKVDDIIDSDKSIPEKAKDLEFVVDQGKKDKDWKEEEVMTVFKYADARNKDNTFNDEVVETRTGEIKEEEPKTEAEPVKEEKPAEIKPEPPKKEDKPQIKEDVQKGQLQKEKAVQKKVDVGEKEVITEKKKEDEVQEKDESQKRKKGRKSEVEKKDVLLKSEKKPKVKPEQITLETVKTKKSGKMTAEALGKTVETKEIKIDGEKVGFVEAGMFDNDIRMNNVRIEEEGAKGIGAGKQAYKNLNEEAKKRGGVLISSETMSNEAENVWKSLVKEGVAEKVDDVYKFKKVEDAKKADVVREEGKKPTEKQKEKGEPVGRVREVDKAKAAQKTLNETHSISSLQDLLSERAVKRDKRFLEKMATAQKYGWYEDSDVDQKVVEKEEKMASFRAKQEAKKAEPQKAGFGFIRAQRFLDPRSKLKPVRPLGKQAKLYFGRTKGMSEAAFEEQKASMGRLRERQFDIKKSVQENLKGIKEAYGRKLEPEDVERLTSALESIGTSKESLDIALQTMAKDVPKEAIPYIVNMRENIDAYSKELAKLDMIGLDLEEKIDKNRGYYLTRTYKKHTDRTWVWESIPDKIKEDALSVVLDLNPELSEDQATGMLRSMLEDQDIVNSVIRQGQSLADIDKGILKKRSQFLTDNPEIRAFLGENRDPFYNYAVSMTKMADMIERGKMIENLIQIGKKEGWLSENPSDSKDLTVKVEEKFKYKGKPGTEKLSNFYTTPEIAQAIGGYLGSDPIQNRFIKAYMRLVTGTKIAKTAGSLKGLIRNFKSNPVNVLTNGNWNIPQTLSEIKTRTKTKADREQFYKELYRKGVIGDSLSTGELIKNIQDLSDKLSYITSSDENVGTKAFRKTRDKALELYGLADDVWKAYRYVSEYMRYNKALSNKLNDDTALEEAKNRAVRILHKTSTYYSELPIAIQNFRKLPFANTFISFPWLTMNNYIGTWETAVEEMKNPDLRHIGIQRMLGAMAGVSTLALAAGLKNMNAGQDPEDMEAWRRFLPDFWKNDIITIKDVKDGKAEYSNTSYMDYYGVITTPVMVLQRKLVANGTLTDDDLIEAVSDFFGNFVQWDIVFNKVTNLKNNEDSSTGYPIYNPQDPWGKRFQDMSLYMAESVEPGLSTDVRRIYKTAREGGEWERQATGVLIGNQNRTIDPVKSLDKYKLYKYRDGINDAVKIYKDEKRRYDRLKSPSSNDKTALRDAKRRADLALNGIIKEIRKDKEALIQVGIPSAQFIMEDLMKGKAFDKDVTDAVIYGTSVTITEEGKIE